MSVMMMLQTMYAIEITPSGVLMKRMLLHVFASLAMVVLLVMMVCMLAVIRVLTTVTR